MKKQFILLGLLSISALQADGQSLTNELVAWGYFCASAVEGNVEQLSTSNRQMRASCLTNVFHSLTTNGYALERYFPPRPYANVAGFTTQSAYYSNTIERVTYIVGYLSSDDVSIGGQIGLMHLQMAYSNRAGPLFWQYARGPGNICLLDLINTAEKSIEIKNLFFCRDNIAVGIRKWGEGGDALAFARLLDACILAAPATPSP